MIFITGSDRLGRPSIQDGHGNVELSKRKPLSCLPLEISYLYFDQSNELGTCIIDSQIYRCMVIRRYNLSHEQVNSGKQL